jgi:hypothetical protein
MICLICNTEFTLKSNLITHLNNNRCKKYNCVKLYQRLEKLKRYLEEQTQIVQEPIIEEIQEIEPIQESIQELIIEEPTQELVQLQFDGVFKGRENEIRITPNKQISVFDFIKVVGGQLNSKDTWKDIEKKYKKEVVGFSDYFKFKGQGQKRTPVINVQGMVKLLFLLPGETAKQFRSKSAEVMIRYLGGDLILIDEIKLIDKEHIINPNNIAQVFREEINNVLFNQDQINTSKKLINYYGDKRDVFYVFSFKYLEDLYVKFGIVGELRDFYEPQGELNSRSLRSQNNTLRKLISVYVSEANASLARLGVIKVVGDRMLDPPPRYNQIENCNGMSLEIEKERTKQKEIESTELTKQKEIESTELTKQKQLELEIKKIKYEMLKLKFR